MKKSSNSNMYAFQLEATREQLADHLAGAPESIVCVLSTSPLSEQAQQALDSSCKALGFDTTCSFLARCIPAASGNQQESESSQKAASSSSASSTTTTASVAALDPTTSDSQQKNETPTADELKGPALFAALEGLDPTMLIITDEPGRQACAEAYRTEIPQNNKGRLFGRTLVSFQDFESLLASPESKQRAWALLKRLAPSR